MEFKKGEQFWIKKAQASGDEDQIFDKPSEYHPESIHVIEYEAYKTAIEALKGQSCDCYQTESDHIPCQRCEALKELGEHE